MFGGAAGPKVENTAEQSGNALARWRKARIQVTSVAKSITLL
jgi:hypothetical protein